MTPDEIISKFRARRYVPMPNIPGNRIFVTDNTASTLVWAEENVIIEQYFLFPNIENPLHSHPFANRLAYMSGDYTAYIIKLDTGEKIEKTFVDSDRHFILPEEPIGQLHGSKTGPRGAMVYNIQIWPDNVTNPLSASLEYIGTTMGPVHQRELTKLK